MRIGNFARLGNVSLRALSFYGQAGLLRPAHVKPENGYRHYDPRQLAQLHQIQLFKDMGLVLEEIRELLAQRSTGAELREVFRKRSSALLKRMPEDSWRLARIDARMRVLQGHRNGASPEVQLRQTRPAWVVSLRERIRHYEGPAFGAVLGRPKRCLKKWSAAWAQREFPGSVRFSGTPVRTKARRSNAKFCDFWSSQYRCEETFELSSCLLLTVASVFHFGGDRTIEDSYRVLAEWLTFSEFRLCGPKPEIYWVEAQHGAEVDALTEIQFPVVQARDAKRVCGIRAA